jgi:hypothetical protein
MLTVQNNRWKNKETIVAKIREVWAASLDNCKFGQQVWTAVLSTDNEKGQSRPTSSIHHSGFESFRQRRQFIKTR